MQSDQESAKPAHAVPEQTSGEPMGTAPAETPLAGPDGHDPHRPVGYGNPPRATQFRKGQSGNPRGRPRQRKSLKTLLDEILYEPIEFRERGQIRAAPAVELMLLSLRKSAISGDLKALDRLIKLTQITSGETDEGSEANTSDTERDMAARELLASWVKEADHDTPD